MRHTVITLALPVSLALVLAACSQSPGPSRDAGLPPGSPYAGGASYPWSEGLDVASPDPYAGGRDYAWSSPVAQSGLSSQAVANGVNYLSDLPWTSATNGWGPVERDMSNGEMDRRDGHVITLVSGPYTNTYAKGLGVHADSEIKYALNGQCSILEFGAGIDKEVGTRGRVTYAVLGDGRILTEGEEAGGGVTNGYQSVNVGGVHELTLRVNKGTNNYYDHFDWGGAKLTCSVPAPTGTVNVSDLGYVSATNGWGPVEIDKSNGEQAQNDGKALTIAGQVFAKGLGVHANSTLTYALGGQCTTFTAKVGVDDEVGAAGSVAFEVRGDGKVLASSGVQRGNSAAPANLTANVSGVQQLQLVVTDAGDGKSSDHADWGSPVLTCTTTQPTVTLDPQTLSIFHKHSATVNATFKNITGPVSLALEPLNGAQSGLQLDTTTAVVSPSGTTQTLTISAPDFPVPEEADQTISYMLVASQNGVEVARGPITITERLLSVTVTLLPDTVTVDPTVDSSKTFTVKVTVDPPLDAIVPVTVGFPQEDYGRTLTAVGPTYGDGGTMYRDYQITFPAHPEYYGQEKVDLMTYASGFLGYRLRGYGSNYEQLIVNYTSP